MTDLRPTQPSATWLLLGLGACLTLAAVWLVIDSVPYWMAADNLYAAPGNHSAGSNRVVWALLCALGAIASLGEYRKRTRGNDGWAAPGRSAKLSIGSRRRLIWVVTALEIAAFAWVVFKMLCPAWLGLEAIGATRQASLSLHGEARCWAAFLTLSGVAVLFAFATSWALSRRARREAVSHGHGA